MIQSVKKYSIINDILSVRPSMGIQVKVGVTGMVIFNNLISEVVEKKSLMSKRLNMTF